MDIKNDEIFKQREFSELISDTIFFYIREAKSLFKYIFKYILFFLISKSLIAHYFSYVFYFEYEYYPNLFELLRYGSGNLVALVLILKTIDILQYTMLIVVVGAYIKLISSKGVVDKKDMGKEVKSIFFKILGSNILITITLSLALVALILPAIYLFIIFSTTPILIIFENKSVGTAMSKSLRMFKGNWWKSFGAFLVISIIYLIFTLIISFIFPRIFMSFGFVPFVFIISSLLTGLLNAFITALPILLAAFLYVSLVVSGNSQEKTKKQKRSIVEDKRPELKDNEKQNNRFLDNNEPDRFKPKY